MNEELEKGRRLECDILSLSLVFDFSLLFSFFLSHHHRLLAASTTAGACTTGTTAGGTAAAAHEVPCPIGFSTLAHSLDFLWFGR